MNEAEITRLSGFLRESMNSFMERLNIEERTSAIHEDQVHFEEWLRYVLATSFLPDVLATICGLAEYNADLLSGRVPALLERSLSALPYVRSSLPGLWEGCPTIPG